MKKTAVLLAIAMWAPWGAALAASLQNTDSQAYELMIAEPNRPYASSYRVVEHAQVEFCFLGCQVTILTTGQTVSVGPQDTVVIDDGVMTVTNQ